MGPGPLLVKARAAKGQGGEVGYVGEEPLVPLGEGAVHAPENQHAECPIPGAHRDSEPVRKSDALRDWLDGAAPALAEVIVRPDRPPGVEYDARQPRCAAWIAVGLI